MHIWALLPILVVTAFDCQNTLAWSRRWVLEPANVACDDFTIVIPLYGNLSYFSGRAQIEHLKRHVLVACGMNTPAMADAADTLEREGWRVLRVPHGGWLMAAPRLMLAALESGLVTTSYTARLDADTALTDGFAHAVEALRRDGADLASMKCHVLEPRNLCEKMQAQEYRMAMLARHYRPRLTSGAGYLGKTESLKRIFELHTGSPMSEDIETGRVAYHLRMRIRHLDYEVLTAAPPTWRALWKQRMFWWAGSIRHTWINLDHNMLHLRSWTLYYLALVWAGLAWKWEHLGQLVTSPLRAAVFLATMYVLYLVLTYGANWQVRGRYMLLMPPYALFQAMMLPPVGILRFVRFVVEHRRLDRYRFGYRRPRLARRVTPELELVAEAIYLGELR